MQESSARKKDFSPKNSLKSQRERALAIVNELEKLYPETNVGLRHSNTFELLIATMLSAQCTDERVDRVTEVLFRKYTSPEDFVSVPREELEMDIRPTGYFRSKAKNIQECCRKMIDDFGGEVPSTIEELVTLPGVGRKTANVVLSHDFGKAAVVVDTHVTRLTNRLGFVATIDAVKIEHHMMRVLPEEKWVAWTHLLITHGRQICVARRPKCEECGISQLCPSAFVVNGKSRK